MRAKFVHEAMAEPFTNPRNMPITSNYPLQRIQYEDADKPKEPDISDEELECDRCGKMIHPGEFIDGVCKACSEQGYYIDRFGTIHQINSRVNRDTKYS